MKCQTLLPNPDCLHLRHVEVDTATITIVVTTVIEETPCRRFFCLNPACQQKILLIR